MFNLPGNLRLVGAVILAALVLATSASALAQTRYSDVPVLVVGEDEDPQTVSRSHEIFQRVIAELKGVMSRAGFRVIDEGAVSVDLGWEIRDRRPKMELIDLAKLMNRSGDATHGVRALVPFSIRAEGRSLHALTRIRIRMKGDIYDLVSNQFIDSFEMEKSFAGPPGCLDDYGCISGVVGRGAREVAATLGATLAEKLARYRHASGSGPRTPVGAVTAAKPAGRGHGLETPYTVTLRYFDRREALTIIGVMADEFPGYNTHTLLTADQATRKYSYITSAKPHKLEEWLTILLEDMNFNPDKEIRIAINGTHIIVEKIVSTKDRPRSRDEKALFK